MGIDAMVKSKKREEIEPKKFNEFLIDEYFLI